MGRAQRTTVALAAAAMVFSAALPAHADPAAAIGLRVVVFDRSSLGSDVVARAQRIASGIFHRVGVDLVWVTEDAFAAGSPSEQRDLLAYCRSVLQLHLTPVSAGGVTSATALGLAPRGSRQIYALTSRIAEAAAQAGADVSVVLGHVIAHELGHLLLGPDTHASEGLMQATFDLAHLADSRLGFDRAQGARIRAAQRRLAASIPAS